MSRETESPLSIFTLHTNLLIPGGARRNLSGVGGKRNSLPQGVSFSRIVKDVDRGAHPNGGGGIMSSAPVRLLVED